MNRLALTILILALAAPCAAQDDKIAALRAKYPWRNIYLTYGNLADLSNLLNGEKRATLVKTTDAAVLKLLESFLKRHTATKFSTGVSLLLLDLEGLRAGYISANQYDGAVTPLNWSVDEVKAVALWADRYLHNATLLAALTQDVLSGNPTIAEAWNRVAAAKAAEFTTASQAADLNLALRGLLERRSDELKSLREKDPQLFAAAERFEKEVDAAVAASKQFRYAWEPPPGQQYPSPWNEYLANVPQLKPKTQM